MKEEKILNILTVIVVIILLGYYIITNSIPNYKKTFGSSDKLINTNNYVNLINMNVNNNINVGFILNDKKQIYYIKCAFSVFHLNLALRYNFTVSSINMLDAMK